MVYAGVHRIDLAAFSGPHVVRVQVKSTLAPRRATKTAKIKYEFLVGSAVGGTRRTLSSEECDVVALVALDKRLCRFMSVEACTKIHWRFLAEEFTVETQEQTLREAFAKYER